MRVGTLNVHRLPVVSPVHSPHLHVLEVHVSPSESTPVRGSTHTPLQLAVRCPKLVTARTERMLSNGKQQQDGPLPRGALEKRGPPAFPHLQFKLWSKK